MPGLSVSEKNHWKERLSKRIDKRIEAISAEDPNLLERVKRDAHDRAMQSLTRRVLRENFPVVRTLQSAEAMNEVLVAGNFVATKSRLQAHDDAFADGRDVSYWNRLKLRRIS